MPLWHEVQARQAQLCTPRTRPGAGTGVQPKQHLYDSGLGNRREKAGSLSAPQLKMVEPEAADSYNGCLRGMLTKRKKLSQEDTVQVPTSSCAKARRPALLQETGQASPALGKATALPICKVLPGSQNQRVFRTARLTFWFWTCGLGSICLRPICEVSISVMLWASS